MYFFLSVTSPPNKVSLISIEELVDFVGKENKLHDMVGNIAKAGLSKSSPPSHVKEFVLPSSKSIMHIIQKELKINKFRDFLKHWKTQIFSKGCTGLDTPNGGKIISSSRTTVGGENDIRLKRVYFFPRILAKAIKDSDGGITKGSINFSK